MKKRFLIIALPCLLLGACKSSADKNSANDKKADSSATTHRDSLLMAAKKNHIQDSIDAAKASDTTKKADTTGGKK